MDALNKTHVRNLRRIVGMVQARVDEHERRQAEATEEVREVLRGPHDDAIEAILSIVAKEDD